ncbi:MAG: methyltransferase domain-containing protein [Pelagimonas sp.]|jgi:predicted TPR repeat methyltransferase|nr:methyltransferase domain-containing protein [Pelagimonas sp.]
MTNSFLDKAYKVKGTKETQALYDAWAPSYDTEIAKHHYVTPKRTAQALRQFVMDSKTPVLDVGCGTGLSGQALVSEGFDVIDGLDVSEPMLRLAEKKAIYRDLILSDPGLPLPRGFRAMAAIGVIGIGGAPISLLDDMIESLAVGGKCAFSFNDLTLRDPGFQDRVDAMITEGYVFELLREYGAHIPGKNLNSTVYVLEKL